MNAENEFRIRPGTLADVAEILRQRRGMYHDMGHTDPAGLDAMVTSSEPCLRSAMADGTLHSWLATTEDGIVVGRRGGDHYASFESSAFPALPRSIDLECVRLS